MSGIDPAATASEINQYKQLIYEAEDNADREIARTKKDAQKDVNDLDKSYQTELRSRDADHAETVKDVKKSGQDQVDVQRELRQDEAAAFKRTYNNRGRMGAENVASQRMNQALEDFEVQQERDKQRMSEVEERATQRIETQEARNSKEKEIAVKHAREGALEIYNKYYEDTDEDYSGTKKALLHKYQILDEDRIDQINQANKKAAYNIKNAKESFEYAADLQSKSAETGLTKKLQANMDQQNQTMRNAAKSRSKETTELRNQIREAAASTGTYQKGRAEGRAEAIKEFNDEWRMKEYIANKSATDQIDKIKNQTEDTETYMSEKSAELLRKKEQQFARVIAESNQENYTKLKEAQMGRAEDQKAAALRLHKENEISDRNLNRQLGVAMEERAIALEKQQKAFNETLSRSAKSNKSEVANLQKALRESRTSTDPNDISPAAEERVRKTYLSEAGKVIEAETEKNQRKFDEQRLNSKNSMDVMRHRLVGEKTRLNQRNTAEMAEQRSNFVDTLSESEFRKKQAIGSQNRAHDRETIKMGKEFSKAMDMQRMRYDEILETAKADADTRVRLVRAEANHETNMARRKNQVEMERLARKGARELENQKDEYQAVLANQQVKFDKEQRNAERAHKKELEDRMKTSEFQIAQMKFQQEEREKYLNEVFEEQLEKMRLANARLINKKS